MKILALMLCVAMTLMARTIGVVALNPDGSVPKTHLDLIASNIESELAESYTVIERQNLEVLLKEHALSLSGATRAAVQVGSLLDADLMAIASVDHADNIWSLCIKIVNVESGTIESITCKAIQGSLDAALAGARFLSGNDQAVIRQVNHQVTVYEPVTTVIHKEMKGARRVFQPCSFCHGKGRLPDGSDCPMCSIANRYNGPETKGLIMTGKWIYVR